MVTDALGALSELLQWLDGNSRNASEQTFRRRALDELNLRVAFDRAIWADATIADQLSLETAELFAIGDHERPDIERAATLDPRLPFVLQAQGTAHAYSVLTQDPSAYRSITARLDIAHVLSIAQFDAVLGRATGLVLCRRASASPFNEESRRLVEVLFPHLFRAWATCQVTQLARRAYPGARSVLHSAVARGSIVDAAEPGFVTLLHREWPGWSGPYLPDPLFDPATRKAALRFLGDHIVVESRPAVDVALVVARERSVVDALTDRERTVAELCARGMTYKEISLTLHLAPATARNHIAAVHKRLNVSRNSEIATLLRAGWLPAKLN